MRRVFELLLGTFFIALVWFAFEFLAGAVFVIAAMVFVALEQVAGRTAAAVLAGTAAGISFGLAPSWRRPAFWLAAGVCAALGFGLEGLTGFLASQTPLDARWAAFSLAAFGGPMLEALGAGPPAARESTLLRLLAFGVLGGVVGASIAPSRGDPGPIAYRLGFALTHLGACGLARRHVAAESQAEARARAGRSNGT